METRETTWSPSALLEMGRRPREVKDSRFCCQGPTGSHRDKPPGSWLQVPGLPAVLHSPRWAPQDSPLTWFLMKCWILCLKCMMLEFLSLSLGWSPSQGLWAPVRSRAKRTPTCGCARVCGPQGQGPLCRLRAAEEQAEVGARSCLGHWAAHRKLCPFSGLCFLICKVDRVR